MKNSIQTEIQAPPDKVFYWLDDSERVMKWVDGVVENEYLEVTEEQVGSTFRQVFLENGKQMEFRGVVTDYAKDRRLAVHLEGDFFDLDVAYVLEPTSVGTRITQNSSVAFKGFWKVMGPIMSVFMKKAGEKKVQEDFGRLRELCEVA